MNPILLAFLITCAIALGVTLILVAIYYIGELVRYIDSRVKFDFTMWFGSITLCSGIFLFVMFLTYCVITNK